MTFIFLPSHPVCVIDVVAQMAMCSKQASKQFRTRINIEH